MEILEIMNDITIVVINVVGSVTILVAIAMFFYTVLGWFFGVAPMIKRFGLVRWFRKIYILAEGDMYDDLKKDLEDSGVFRKRNIFKITKNHLLDVKDIDFALIHYQSFTKNTVKQILKDRKPKAGFVFYYPEFDPQNGKMIPRDMIKLINKHQFTTVVNFRGRLINDLVTTLLSTSYDKR